MNGIDFSHESLGKIDVPDGLGVKLLGDDGKVLAIVGPFKTSDLHICPNWSWNKIELYQRYESISRYPNTMVKRHLYKRKRQKVATASTRSEKKSIADERADLKVVACTKPFLKGFCMQYGSSFIRSDSISPFSGGLQTGCKVGIQSMRIPSGILINGIQSFDMQRSAFGPYIGPVLIDKMGGGAKYEIAITNLFKEQHSKNVASEKVLKNETVFHDGGTADHSSEQNIIDVQNNKVATVNQTKVSNSTSPVNTTQIANHTISTNESGTDNKTENITMQNGSNTGSTITNETTNEPATYKNKTVFGDLPSCNNHTPGMMLEGKYNNDKVHINVNSCKFKNKTNEGQLSCASALQNACNSSISIDIFFVKALEKAKQKTVFGDFPCVPHVVCNENEMNAKNKTVFGDCPCTHQVFHQNVNKNTTVFGDLPCFLPLVCEDVDFINKVIDLNSKVKSVLKKMPCKMILHCKNSNISAIRNESNNIKNGTNSQNPSNESLVGNIKVNSTNQKLGTESLIDSRKINYTNLNPGSQSLIKNTKLNVTIHEPVSLVSNKTENISKLTNQTNGNKEHDNNEWVAEFVNEDDVSNVSTVNKSLKKEKSVGNTKMVQPVHNNYDVIDDGDEDEDAFAAIEEHKNENDTGTGGRNVTTDTPTKMNNTDEMINKKITEKFNATCLDPIKCGNETTETSCKHNNSCAEKTVDEIKPSEKFVPKKITTVFEDKPFSLFKDIAPSGFHTNANKPVTIGLIMNKNFTAVWKSSCDLPKFCKNAFSNDIRCKIPNHCNKVKDNHGKDISVSYPASLDETYCPIYEDEGTDDKALCNKTMNNIKRVTNEVTVDKINIDFQQLLCNFANRCNKTEDEIKTIKKEILASIIDKVDGM